MFVKGQIKKVDQNLRIDILLGKWYDLPDGEMSERFKEPVLKTGDGATHRGFESHSLRHRVCCKMQQTLLILPCGRANC